MDDPRIPSDDGDFDVGRPFVPDSRGWAAATMKRPRSPPRSSSLPTTAPKSRNRHRRHHHRAPHRGAVVPPAAAAARAISPPRASSPRPAAAAESPRRVVGSPRAIVVPASVASSPIAAAASVPRAASPPLHTAGARRRRPDRMPRHTIRPDKALKFRAKAAVTEASRIPRRYVSPAKAATRRAKAAVKEAEFLRREAEEAAEEARAAAEEATKEALRREVAAAVARPSSSSFTPSESHLSTSAATAAARSSPSSSSSDSSSSDSLSTSSSSSDSSSSDLSSSQPQRRRQRMADTNQCRWILDTDQQSSRYQPCDGYAAHVIDTSSASSSGEDRETAKAKAFHRQWKNFQNTIFGLFVIEVCKQQGIPKEEARVFVMDHPSTVGEVNQFAPCVSAPTINNSQGILVRELGFSPDQIYISHNNMNCAVLLKNQFRESHPLSSPHIFRCAVEDSFDDDAINLPFNGLYFDHVHAEPRLLLIPIRRYIALFQRIGNQLNKFILSFTLTIRHSIKLVTRCQTVVEAIKEALGDGYRVFRACQYMNEYNAATQHLVIERIAPLRPSRPPLLLPTLQHRRQSQWQQWNELQIKIFGMLVNQVCIEEGNRGSKSIARPKESAKIYVRVGEEGHDVIECFSPMNFLTTGFLGFKPKNVLIRHLPPKFLVTGAYFALSSPSAKEAALAPLLLNQLKTFVPGTSVEKIALSIAFEIGGDPIGVTKEEIQDTLRYIYNVFDFCGPFTSPDGRYVCHHFLLIESGRKERGRV